MFISLGGNCSIKYQLIKHNLDNKVSYPFDWCKISIKQLINVLQNNFNEFSSSLYISHESKLHLLLSTSSSSPSPSSSSSSSSFILKNKYNIMLAHEIKCESELDIFKQSINRRIERFNIDFLKNPIFIRIEIKPISCIINYTKDLDILLNLLYPNKLILIINNKYNIHEDFYTNLKIYYYDDIFIDWKMENIDWIKIFKENKI
jgi:hypothetical protein